MYYMKYTTYENDQKVSFYNMASEASKLGRVLVKVKKFKKT